MDKSWIRNSRTKKQYIDRVEAFIKYAVHNLQKMRNIDPRGNKQQLMMPCPCTTCLNHIEHKVEEVQFHLFKYVIDLSYTKWDKHGEKDEQATTAQIPVNATTEFVDDMNFDMDFGLEIPTNGPTIVEMVNATKEIKLLNLKGKYGASDKFFIELLGLLKKMLHAGNEMVEKTYQAKKLMRMMGSGYKKIHVCSNNCILYWKDNKELTVCPTCGISRWKVDNKTHKVYENIPAKAWRTIDEKFPEIAKDLRNLRLGISADGVDVNSRSSHHNQFWSTAKVKTVNGVVQLQALIDGKKVFVSEAIIRRDLHLEDAEGVECLPNNEIFEELARMGYEKPPPKLTFYKAFFAPQWKFLIHTLIQCLSAKRTAWNEFSSTMASAVICLATGRKFNFSKYIFDSMVRNVDSSAKFLMYPRFIQVFLDNQVDDMTSHHTKYTSPALTQKVFANIRRVGKGFSGNETPLFDTMLVQPQTQADEDVEMPVDEEQPATTSAPSTSEPQDQPSTPHDSPEQEPTHSSPHDSPLTGVNPPRSEEGSLQLAELMALYTSLQRKKRVEKQEKKRKSKPSVLRRLRKIGSATRVESSEEASLGVEENASKQGGMISDIDADAEISLVDETQRLDDDLIFDTTADLGGEEVVVKPAETGVSPALDVEVSAAEPAVTTVSSLVTTDSVTITAVEPVSAAAKELTDNDMTMAEALAELKTSKPKVVTTVPILNSATTVTTTKPKAKGITIQEPSVTQKTAVSFISSSKGKAIMIESEKPVKIKDQIAHDEQVAKDLHDKIQVELEEEAKRQEEASMATIAELYDAVQAQIYADQELAARMTLEEHEKYTVEDRARMLAEFIKNKKKQLAVERAEAIRSKPPTKSQLRNLMMTYLKNTGRFTHAQLKNRDFEEIQGLYNKEKELVDTFVPIGSEEDERRIKELNTKAEEESSNKDVDSTNKRKKRIRMKRSSKKQKTDADLKEEEQLKTFLSIVPNEEEAIDYEVLDKRYQIVDWKSEFYHNDRYGEPHDYYRVFRADGSSRYIKTFTKMVSKFDRMDFLELHSLVMQRFETTTPKGIDLILWGDLKTMFEGNAVDELWKNQEDWILKSWNSYEICRVHILMLEDVESESEAAFDLLRFIQKQIDEM
ncbi:putative ribonuclease H-like domain-containing protein [Tanacetum coccineum]